MPICPDCGGIMIKIEEDSIRMKKRGRWVTIERIVLSCIECGSEIGLPKEE